MDKLSRILGTFDENLTLLSRELDLTAYVDGVKIHLEGEEEAEVYIMKIVTDGDTEEFLPADEDKMDALVEIVEELLSEECDCEGDCDCDCDGNCDCDK